MAQGVDTSGGNIKYFVIAVLILLSGTAIGALLRKWQIRRIRADVEAKAQLLSAHREEMAGRMRADLDDLRRRDEQRARERAERERVERERREGSRGVVRQDEGSDPELPSYPAAANDTVLQPSEVPTEIPVPTVERAAPVEAPRPPEYEA